MNIDYESFESNDDVCEWLLETLLKWAMKGTSQGKYNTLLRLVIKKVFLLSLQKLWLSLASERFRLKSCY